MLPRSSSWASITHHMRLAAVTIIIESCYSKILGCQLLHIRMGRESSLKQISRLETSAQRSPSTAILKPLKSNIWFLKVFSRPSLGSKSTFKKIRTAGKYRAIFHLTQATKDFLKSSSKIGWRRLVLVESIVALSVHFLTLIRTTIFTYIILFQISQSSSLSLLEGMRPHSMLLWQAVIWPSSKAICSCSIATRCCLRSLRARPAASLNTRTSSSMGRA